MSPRRQEPIKNWIWIALAIVCTAGIVLRVIRFGDSVFGDELSTLYVVRSGGLGDVFHLVSSDAEISPPLYFVLAWLTTHIGSGPEWVRLPSLIAGIASLPLIFFVGRRVAGPVAGLLSAGFMAFNPFATFYSTDGRAYAVALALLLLSTLAMLIAVDEEKRRWWVVYGAASCLAMYAHYTCAFVLLAQLAWLLWAHPPARLSALIANVAAAVLFIPWIPSMLSDTKSPTIDVLAALQGDGFAVKRAATENWVFGTPYITPETVPGNLALTLGIIGLAVAALAAGYRLLGPSRARLRARIGRESSRRVVLVLLLFLATPAAEALLLFAGGSDLYGARNLLTSTPGLALSSGVLVSLAGPVFGAVAAAGIVFALSFGAGKLTEDRYGGVDFQTPAATIEREAGPNDVIVDLVSAAFSPVPLTPLDAELDRQGPEFRVFLPDGPPPFLYLDPPIRDPNRQVAKAFREADGNRVFLLTAPATMLERAPNDEPASLEDGANRLFVPRGWSVESSDVSVGYVPLHLTVLVQGPGGLTPAAQ